MKQNESLRELKIKVQNCRLSAQGSKHPRLPSDLKKKIVSAAEEFGFRHVSDYLKVARNTIRGWAADDSLKKCKDSTVELDFVELAGSRVASAERLEVTLPSGITISASVSVPPLLVARLCKALGGRNP